jgi:hypothetical protein
MGLRVAVDVDGHRLVRPGGDVELVISFGSSGQPQLRRRDLPRVCLRRVELSSVLRGEA